MRILLLFCVIIVSLTGCGPSYVDCFPYHDDGRNKPVVAILPMIDCSESGLNWNLGEEFDVKISDELVGRGNLFIISNQAIERGLGRCKDSDLFGVDLSFANNFSPAEFVVVTEVIEHEIVPYQPGKITPLYPTHHKQCASVLMMKVRIRVIDIRCDKPTIVLQEIFKSNHMIPKDKDNLDYTSYCWGNEPYTRTPFCLCHKRLAKDIVERIECVTQQWR